MNVVFYFSDRKWQYMESMNAWAGELRMTFRMQRHAVLSAGRMRDIIISGSMSGGVETVMVGLLRRSQMKGAVTDRLQPSLCSIGASLLEGG